MEAGGLIRDVPVRCPRCGYDLRGATATWADTCPIEGVCTECGLAYRWCDVLRPDKFEPRWCIEFEPRRSRVPLAAAKTWARSWLPWVFWSNLQMSHPVRWPRLALYVAMLALPLLALYVIAQGGAATWVRLDVQAYLTMEAQGRASLLRQHTAQRNRLTGMLTGDAFTDRQTQAQITMYNTQITRLQALGTAPLRIDANWLHTTWDCIARPLSGMPRYSIVASTGFVAQPYPSPLNVLFMLNQSARGWGNWGGVLDEQAFLTFAWFAWAVGISVLMPLSFALMPISLRRAKVRLGHIVRVTAYGACIPFALLAFGFATLWPALVLYDSPETISLVRAIAMYAPWIAIAIWWHEATRRYLKIAHAWLAIGMLTLMCLLVLLGITAAIDPIMAWEMLDLFKPLIW